MFFSFPGQRARVLVILLISASPRIIASPRAPPWKRSLSGALIGPNTVISLANLTCHNNLCENKQSHNCCASVWQLFAILSFPRKINVIGNPNRTHNCIYNFLYQCRFCFYKRLWFFRFLHLSYTGRLLTGGGGGVGFSGWYVQARNKKRGERNKTAHVAQA